MQTFPILCCNPKSPTNNCSPESRVIDHWCIEMFIFMPDFTRIIMYSSCLHAIWSTHKYYVPDLKPSNFKPKDLFQKFFNYT